MFRLGPASGGFALDPGNLPKQGLSMPLKARKSPVPGLASGRGSVVSSWLGHARGHHGPRGEGALEHDTRSTTTGGLFVKPP